jgi:two-component system alkaline phosphatase synthesis response regulator PhoP
MHTVLLVEDSKDAFHLVKSALGSSVQLEWASSFRLATEMLSKTQFDLILLDVTLPDGDGYQLCSVLQTNKQLKGTPVIFITAKSTIADKVLGFSVGADDYIPKPFDRIELKARVDARLRRCDLEKIRSDVIRLGDIEVNKAIQKAYVYKDNKPVEIDLTPIEFKILLHLSKDTGKVSSRDEILNSVWGDSINVVNRSVDTHMSKLRKKLGSRANLITSVHGAGYRFVPNMAQNRSNFEAPKHSLLA